MTNNTKNPAAPAVRSSDWLAFNINDEVAVRLTAHGREVHRRNYLNLELSPSEYRPPIEDAEGWSHWQLWDLMQEFGPHIYMGGKNCFATDIRVKANDKADRRVGDNTETPKGKR